MHYALRTETGGFVLGGKMNKFRSMFGMRGLSLILCLMLVASIVAFGAARAVYADEGEGSSDTAETTETVDSADPGEDGEKPGEVGDTDPGDTTTTGETEGSAEAEPEKPKVEFVLWKKLKKVDTKGWIMFAAAAVIAVGMIVFLATRKKGVADASMQKVSPTLILVHGALCIALSFVLSYIKLFSMPLGGSVTLASMLPLMVYSNRHGVKWGLLAGVVYGFLQYIQGGWFVHWVQLLLDYPVAFGLIGLAGLVRGDRNLALSALIGGIGRFVAVYVSGWIFWYDATAANGLSPAVYSLIYNGYYMVPEIAICVVIALLPPFRKAIRKALKY